LYFIWALVSQGSAGPAKPTDCLFCKKMNHPSIVSISRNECKKRKTNGRFNLEERAAEKRFYAAKDRAAAPLVKILF
jgi:hypothetical protein